MAAAAWSCVEKMLQLHQRTCAPSAVRVSIKTAVWIVMCREPVMRAPLSGCSSVNSARNAMRPGISCSASSISLRPNAASERSATLKSSAMSGYLRMNAMNPELEARLGPAGPLMTAQAHATLVGERGLHVIEDRDRTRIDAFVRRHVQADHRPVVHEVEHLREAALARGLHLFDAGHDLFGPLPHEIEAPHDLRVLVVVAQEHEREHLAGHVAVLRPSRDLVVRQLRDGVHERGDLRVLVHLVLPPHRRNRSEPAAAVHEWDRAPDAARQFTSAVLLFHQLVAADL